MESKATSETPAVEQTETCAECPVKVWTSAEASGGRTSAARSVMTERARTGRQYGTDD